MEDNNASDSIFLKRATNAKNGFGEDSNGTKTNNLPTHPKAWFKSLSNQEKSIALSIGDSSFIGMFLDLVEISSSNVTVNNASAATTTIPKMDLMKQVKVQDLDKLYDVQPKPLMTSPMRPAENSSTGDPLQAQVDEDSKTTSSASAGMSVPAVFNERQSADVEQKCGINDTVTDSSGPSIIVSSEVSSTPLEAIVSTAFRIQEPLAIEIDKKPKAEGAAGNETERRTLHFKSGLSIPDQHCDSNRDISVIASTRTGAITSTSKLNGTAKIKTVDTDLATSNAPKDDSNDVHCSIRFGALQMVSKPGDPDTEANRKNAQRIAETKQFAARAMLPSSNQAAGRRLLKNLRFAFSSARNFKNVTTKLSSVQDSEPLEEDSIVMTLDPSYLSEQSGMQFLSDVQNVIDSELQMISTSNDDGDACKHSKFLSEDFRIQSGNSYQGLPSWLHPFLQTPNTDVSMILILLARIEQSILQFYKEAQLQGGNNDSSTCDNADGSKKLPYAFSQGLSASKSKPNVEIGGFDKARNSFSSPQCLTFSRGSETGGALLSEIFKLWNRLKAQKQLSKDLHVPSLPISSMRVQDLLLVPSERVLLALPSNKNESVASKNRTDLFISKWNHIIDAANDIVCATKLERKNIKPFSVSDNEVVELFADDTFKNKIAKNKKKKKKKKKKRKGSNNRKNGIPFQSKTEEERPTKIQEVKAEDEKAASLNVSADADCSSSILSTISAISKTLQKAKIENTKEVEPKENVPKLTRDMTISKVNGLNGVVSLGRVEDQVEDSNDDGWETVEPKGGRAKKIYGIGKSNHEKNQAGSQKSSSGSRKNKGKSKSRNRNRQKEKEQAKANLDSLEGDIAKRGANTTKALMEERNKRQSSISKKKMDGGHSAEKHNNRSMSNRDADLSNLSSSRFLSDGTLKRGSALVRNKGADSTLTVMGDLEKNASQQKKRLFADQNTASTIQETVSAASRSFPHTDDTSKLSTAKMALPKFASESATNVTEHRENLSESSTLDGRRTPSPRKSSAPPLQTLVGPGHLNSANSSVASSLEAPHATRHGAHKHTSSKEDDVGYHLLKVCERLSDDMSSFMTRRALALSSRRRERGTLLASLQETVQSIWVGRCHVEMYGSCATQLDLPSSDLDVVVCGLDRPENKGRRQSFGDDCSEATAVSATPALDEETVYANQFYPPLSVNGTRVMRLATELERAPWAVQVKPIPTASVPVIKILADPSRLPGATGMNWMLHQQQIAAASVAAADMKSGKLPLPQKCIDTSEHSSIQSNESRMGDHNSSVSMSHHIAAMSGLPASSPSSYPSTPQPWRGADVMNGLLSLDITFEGPEHGGLGSTAFSARVVQDACNESGLPPESTPAVQVLMIIKEMLAQRRLNEPFSGGLSSYAILLLVDAVVKERRIIRKEIERVEKQRQAVESSNVNHEVGNGYRSRQEAKNVIWPVEKQPKKHKSENEEMEEIKPLSRKRSSWASIAMKSTSNTTQEHSREGGGDDSSSKKVDEAILSKSTKTDAPTSPKMHQQGPHESLQDSTLFPQGSNDVLEVLCSGEPTAGKLLMHFLLFYGRHFDANSTCIDVSGTHHPDYKTKKNSKMHSNLQLSPFTERKAGGTYNPITDVYTVDPLIVYDPLEGAETNNVARSCYAWGNIRWIFEQCYNTLLGVVELGAGSSTNRTRSKTWPTQENVGLPLDNLDVSRHVDELSPLLELLLSF